MRSKTAEWTCSGLAHAGDVKTDSTGIGLGKHLGPHDYILPPEAREDARYDAEEYSAQVQKTRTLLEKSDKSFDDLPLTLRRRLHDQARKRCGLLHHVLSNESFRPGAGRVADTYAAVALDAYLPPRTTQRLFEHFPELRTWVQTDLSAIHQSMYYVAFFPIYNTSDEPILVLHSTRFGLVTLRPDLGISQDDFTFVSPADSDWEGVDRISALA
eukprot:5133676-Pleurochrysis_carterae.AAC.1